MNKKTYYESNKAYRQAHPEIYREASKKWYRANKEKALAKAKEYRENNQESRALTQEKYREVNLERLRELDRKRYWENREAELARNRKYRQENYERLEAIRIERTYGVTPEQYKELSEKQGGLCAICSKKPRRLYVDHQHATAQVRGLLCHSCNVALGHFRENQEILQKAQQYLST